MSDNRVFSEKEAAEILQRAARFQESSSGGSYAAGITLNELQKIAFEAGIDEANVRKALDRPSQTKTSLLNLVEETERVIDGEMTPEAMDAFAEVISKYGRLQQVSQVGRSFSGIVNGGVLYAKVELHSRNGRTRLKVKSMPLMAYLIGLHAPLIVGLCAGVGLMGSHMVALGLAVMSMLLLVGFLAFTYLAKGSITKSRKLADDIEHELVALHPNPTSSLEQSQEVALEERAFQIQKATH